MRVTAVDLAVGGFHCLFHAVQETPFPCQGAHAFLKIDLRPRFGKFKTYRQCAYIKVRIRK